MWNRLPYPGTVGVKIAHKMFVRFPLEAVPVAHRGSICCFQDFLKEKDETSVPEEQGWERVK